MRHRARELGWGALGFLAAFLIFIGVAALWGIHIDRIGQVIVVHRPAARRPSSTSPGVPPGGDALQPAPTAGQQPAPAPAGDTGGSKPPRGDGGGEHSPPESDGNEPPVQGSPESTAVSQPPPASAVPTEPQAEPGPINSAPEHEATGLLTPALTTVCSVVDHVAHLC